MLLLSLALPRTRTIHATTALPGRDDVLRFWFGRQWFDGGMESPEYFKAQTKRWFMGGKAMDEEAQQFVPLIRAAGKSALTGDVWCCQDGLVARLILLDQLSRNAFRGSSEAFEYDEMAQACAAELLDTPSTLQLPAPVALFIGTALMHSEDLGMHERCRLFLEAHVERSDSPLLRSQLEGDLPAHTDVLRRFGRYPHRNAVKQRETTSAEAAWLSSVDCPGWAKSQAPANPGTTAEARHRSSMRDLIVVDSRGEGAAHANLVGRALEAWPEWRCAAYPASPAGKFEESRWWEAAGREAAAEERCLITAGRAILWPYGESTPPAEASADVAPATLAPIEIAAGDWVTFKRGFLCTWVVTEPIAKNYAYFSEEGKEL